MKTQTLLKTITVAGALAATLSLSACDMHISFGPEGQGQEQQGQPAQSEDAQNPETDTTQAAEEPTSESHSSSTSTSDSAADGSTSNGTSSSGSAANGTTSSSGSTDSSSSSSASDSSTSSGSSSSGGSAAGEDYQGPRIGEEGVELDLDGNGRIPADALEKDIKHAYAEQGTTVDTVDCYADLRITARRGSQNCTVTAAGKNHYGTVKITSASQSGIGYSLEFPNI
ncbi:MULTISPECIES: hypothetical protein [unclassified Brevibacterium]|uniref:hypothetical protein n=1 Tax=unclassified Brevibacterium TaxID=2614124 RepID=UPI001080CA28|nr:hypothetical protein [Brevibacterium sp. S111]TGD13673.1 hypothetical protein EB836_01365 [Brevibacterium sp. S111]